jgi:hypothetical protein
MSKEPTDSCEGSKKAADAVRRARHAPDSGETNMAEVIKEKVQNGELSPGEARKLFEEVHKQLDA